MRQAVIFDLDGTLTQSEEGIWNCVKHVCSRMGLPQPDAETLRRFIGPPLKWSFMTLLGMDGEQAETALAVYRERYLTVGYLENRVYPGIRRLLRTLKARGDWCAIATGKPQNPSERIAAFFGLDAFLDRLVGTRDDLHTDKEDLIREALPEDLSAYDRVWMVGDRSYDMEGGVKAGVSTLGALWGYGSREELEKSGAEVLAATPQEAIRILCPDAEAPRGFFVSMEGLDGSGKGTQLERLTVALDRFGFEVRRSREPGGGPISERIRELILSRENTGMAAECEALLYAASRAQHVRDTIRPALEAGELLLCDRYLDSSVAYQGGGRGLGVDTVLALNERAVDGLLPDLTVFLDIDHAAAMKRRLAASTPDRMEMEPEAFHARVEQAYRELIRRDPARFIVVRAEGDRERIAEETARRTIGRLMEMERQTPGAQPDRTV